jgi:hypothetical protein
VTPEVALQVAGLVLTGGVGLLFWSLKRNVSDVDKKLGRMESDLRQAAASIGAHETRLAEGGVRIENLEERVKGLEDRERTRGCFGACRVGAPSGEG